MPAGVATKLEAPMRRKLEGKGPEFGKRGRHEVEHTEHVATAMERLVEFGKRWLGRKAPAKKKATSHRRPS
jgi:hypothetical protein